ncbi:hypothetical protein BpHYR1_006380 [Brachionus plicatilis]|uniref:Uncharacterized protein n=1 Tax=Brachionus plicatilis TaxID=10195 RepID=A0A3M7R6W5_BRAPC|nr:hypothetical protein BpHYR1_006380 [Brachionus plicatilis]
MTKFSWGSIEKTVSSGHYIERKIFILIDSIEPCDLTLDLVRTVEHFEASISNIVDLIEHWFLRRALEESRIETIYLMESEVITIKYINKDYIRILILSLNTWIHDRSLLINTCISILPRIPLQTSAQKTYKNISKPLIKAINKSTGSVLSCSTTKFTQRADSFTNRVVNQWSVLPSAVTNSDSVNQFKNRYNAFMTGHYAFLVDRLRKLDCLCLFSEIFFPTHCLTTFGENPSQFGMVVNLPFSFRDK